MNEVLTIGRSKSERSKSRLDAEWILLVEDPELTEKLEVVGGKVLYHSADRDEFYRKAVELRPKHFASLYMGQMPERIWLSAWKFIGSDA